jgi:Polyketide cyclase / dehydrase and lipid transport
MPSSEPTLQRKLRGYLRLLIPTEHSGVQASCDLHMVDDPKTPRQLTTPAPLVHTDQMDTLRHSGSIVIKRSPEELYDMVADVTRMGEWSPVCTACWWDEGDGPHVGAKFTGRNERPERTWETRSEVVTADRGREFAWVVAEPPTRARWGYSFVAVDGGTEVTETWELPPEGSAFFEKMFGDDAAKEIGIRSDAAKNGIGATLAAIKRAAEA